MVWANKCNFITNTSNLFDRSPLLSAGLWEAGGEIHMGGVEKWDGMKDRRVRGRIDVTAANGGQTRRPPSQRLPFCLIISLPPSSPGLLLLGSQGEINNMLCVSAVYGVFIRPSVSAPSRAISITLHVHSLTRPSLSMHHLVFPPVLPRSSGGTGQSNHVNAKEEAACEPGVCSSDCIDS
ncbi:unnamed protein product [Pleuronectes platessa]|uniref:Uncharacterized protein n=1 Tax=Pleuronectes platessa TaxID=8262 RepID=A0A9N7VC60_PLEPL|nr:unnamed protein product [Pleuronectes platessa]